MSEEDVQFLEFVKLCPFERGEKDEVSPPPTRSLIVDSGGHHPGIFLVRQDNDLRDMKPHEIVALIANLIASATPILDETITLNHHRGRAV